MWKKSYFMVLLLVLSTAAYGQQVKVEHALEQLGEGYNSAFRVSMPHTSLRKAEKKWSAFIKTNKGRVKTSRGVIRGENVVINGVSPDTIFIFSRLVEDADGVVLKAAFRKGTVYISPEHETACNQRLEQLLLDFALEASKEGLSEKLELATRLLKDTQKEQVNLEKTNERLAAENENMKKRIAGNEQQIKDNTGKTESLRQQVKVQQQSLELLRVKLSELK